MVVGSSKLWSSQSLAWRCRKARNQISYYNNSQISIYNSVINYLKILDSLWKGDGRNGHWTVRVFYKIISSWTLTLSVLFGRTMLLTTTTSSSTATASPGSRKRALRLCKETMSLKNGNGLVWENRFMHKESTKDCNPKLGIVVPSRL